MFYIKKLV